MNNSDMPAMPVGLVVTESGDMYGCEASELGLTKREHFAGLAMQGFIASGYYKMNMAVGISARAVRAADALLAELDK